MSGDIEAAGEIASGAIFGRAVEPRAGEASGGGHGGLCLNCGVRLTGAYCAHCGQQAHVHRTLASIIHDILHGVFHFEGKFWATLPMLAWRPGELTRRYVHGERAKFVSPMAIFLFSVFLMFAVLASLPGWSMGDGNFLNNNVSAKIDTARESLAEGRKKAEGNVSRYAKRLAERRAESPADTTAIAVAERRLAAAREELAGVAKAQTLLPAVVAKERKASTAPATWLEEKYRHAKENPKLLLYKLKSSAYKFSWALIPFSLPFIWLLFPFRRSVGMYDHAIFATYSLSFMSLLTVTLGLLGWIGVPTAIIVLSALVVPPIHIYRQLKGAYGLGRFGAVWRTFWMLVFVTIIVPLFGLFLLYLGVAD